MINIGYQNYAAEEKIVAVLCTGSSPIRRLIKESKENGMLLDATLGKKTRSVLVMDSGHVILSAITPETILERCQKADRKSIQDEI